MTSPDGDDLVSSLGNVGTIGFGPPSVAVGPLLLALRGIWPLRGRHTVISGSVQRYGTTTRLASRLRRGVPSDRPGGAQMTVPGYSSIAKFVRTSGTPERSVCSVEQ